MPNENKDFGVLTKPILWRDLRVPLAILLAAVVGYILGYWNRSQHSSKVIAMQRTLFVHRLYSNPLPAVVLVNVERTSNGYLAFAEMAMTYPRFGTGYRNHDLGTVPTKADAIGKWAFVNWADDGLHLGRGTNEFVIKHKELESGGR